MLLKLLKFGVDPVSLLQLTWYKWGHNRHRGSRHARARGTPGSLAVPGHLPWTTPALGGGLPPPAPLGSGLVDASPH